MRHVGCLSVVVFALVAACPAQAEPQAEQPSIEALMKKIESHRAGRCLKTPIKSTFAIEHRSNKQNAWTQLGPEMVLRFIP